MPLPNTPESWAKVFIRLNDVAAKKNLRVISALTLAVERKTKENLSQFPHPLGTRTPAQPGGPPGLISGTLRRAVTHQGPKLDGFSTYSSKVGLAAGVTAPYSKTPAATVGRILENGETRNGVAYPFLRPAIKWGADVKGPELYRQEYGRWPRVDY